MSETGYSIKHLQVVSISADRFYFFALGSKSFTTDRIICIFTVDGGKKFESTKIDLPNQGFQQNDIRKISQDGWFLFGGYDNEIGYTATALAFKINDDGTEIHGAPYESQFAENIVDFELVAIEKNRAVMITALQYDSHANFHLIQVDDKGAITLLSKQIATITPLFEEAHREVFVEISLNNQNQISTTINIREVVFKCKESAIVSTNFTCLMTGLNMFSYVSTFTLKIKESPELNDQFIQSQVTSKLKNIVNLKPLTADFYDNHVAVLAENTLRLNKEAKAEANSFFEDSHVVLIYKVDTAATSTPVERDVYRILDSTDLGVLEKNKLSSLDPRFFRGIDSKVRLGLNIGLEAKSIKVFSLDGLVAILDKSKPEHVTLNFNFLALDRREFPLKASEIYDNNSNPSGDKKNPLLMITIIAAVVFVVCVVITGIFYTRSQSKGSGVSYDEGLDDVEKSMRNNEDSIGDGYKRA